MKKLQKLLFLLVILVVIAPATRAQVTIKQVEIDGNTDTNTISEEDLISRFSGLTVIENLHQLAADASQVASINVEGNRNTAIISQQGSSNIGAINMIGDNNSASIDQNGSYLLSLMHIRGNLNDLDLIQEGSELGNLVQVEGSGLNIDLLQDKTGFQYSQRGNANPVTITSTQSYVPIIIRNN